MGSTKALCDWDKEQLLTEFAKFRAIVIEPRYLCRKCGRVANEKEWLCRPLSLNPCREAKDQHHRPKSVSRKTRIE
jgi:hypothetical protein